MPTSTQTPLPSEDKLTFFKDLIHCGYNLAFREYDNNGTLLGAEPESDVADNLFEKSGCLEYAIENCHAAPLFLSSGFGLLWGAVSVGEATERRLHVIGPAMNTVILQEDLSVTIQKELPYLDVDDSFQSFLMSLPVIPMQMFQHYILMLNLALTGQKLQTSDILYQTTGIEEKVFNRNAQKRNRHMTYMAEQELFYNVREGNMDFKKALARSASLSTGVQIKTANPLGQATISVVVFTSLCAREAIKGGLSPDIAYAVGDAYIQNMVEAKTISSLSSLSHAMYTDFIGRVHKVKAESNYSQIVQECCDYIFTHMEDELSATLLSQQFGYTPYYLSRKFKAETGMGLTQYIDSVRIEKAKTLLLSTNETIASIAAQLRYCSSTYFSETFRRLTGQLPSDYRKTHGSTC
jgi:YesN/AraC family two-component response regulator